LKLKELKPDGLIVSDPGVLNLIKEIYPQAEIHLSTQANCTNWQAAKFWHEQGIKKIILAREVTLDQIKQIHEKVPEVELEYFIHGAMCISYSGRCLLSKYYMNRSGNLGDCAQPCRWKYKVLEEKKRPGNLLPIYENEHGTYIMNSKDLCLIDYLDDLIEAGISSFKIEGRAKSLYYIANTTKVYRQAIDLIGQKNKEEKIQQLKNELKKNTHRDFTTGFIFGREKIEQKYDSGHLPCEWEFIGMVTNNKCVKVKVHNAIYQGDEVEFIMPQGENFSVKLNEFFNAETGEKLLEAHGGQNTEILIPLDKELPEFTVLRKKVKLEEKEK